MASSASFTRLSAQVHALWRSCSALSVACNYSTHSALVTDLHSRKRTRTPRPTKSAWWWWCDYSSRNAKHWRLFGLCSRTVVLCSSWVSKFLWVFFFLKKRSHRARQTYRGAKITSILTTTGECAMKESRVVLVDISRAMGKDLEVAKKQLLSTLHRTFQVTWRANSSSDDCN